MQCCLIGILVRARMEVDVCEYIHSPHKNPKNWQFLTLVPGRSMTGRSKVDQLIYGDLLLPPLGLSLLARSRLRCWSASERVEYHAATARVTLIASQRFTGSQAESRGAIIRRKNLSHEGPEPKRRCDYYFSSQVLQDQNANAETSSNAKIG